MYGSKTYVESQVKTKFLNAGLQDRQPLVIWKIDIMQPSYPFLTLCHTMLDLINVDI